MTPSQGTREGAPEPVAWLVTSRYGERSFRLRPVEGGVPLYTLATARERIAGELEAVMRTWTQPVGEFDETYRRGYMQAVSAVRQGGSPDER
jgi:hypothetical protein